MAKITNTEGAVKKNPLAKFAKSVGTQRLRSRPPLMMLGMALVMEGMSSGSSLALTFARAPTASVRLVRQR